MSLATRCTSCGTVFRVVQDQLKVSEGWVRCGRCNEVFNALQGLFDLERDAPTEWSSPPTPALAAPTSLQRQPGDETAVESEDEQQPLRDPSLVDKIDAQLLSPRRTGFGALATLAPTERRHEDFADARFDTDLPPEGTSDLSIGLESTAPGAIEGAAETPEFVRQAESEARWHGSPVRASLFVACVALAVALLMQVGHHFRDRVAVQWPALRPPLQAWCRVVSCRLEAPRRIGDVSVESTALTRAAVAPDAFLLSVVLRNRASTPLSVPWIDLSLTDAGGQLVARRALAPKDFSVEPEALAAGAEMGMQLTLSAGGGRVIGYTVEVFYP